MLMCDLITQEVVNDTYADIRREWTELMGQPACRLKDSRLLIGRENYIGNTDILHSVFVRRRRDSA